MKTDTSSLDNPSDLTTSSPATYRLAVKRRSHLFYNKYKYCASACIPWADVAVSMANNTTNIVFEDPAIQLAARHREVIRLCKLLRAYHGQYKAVAHGLVLYEPRIKPVNNISCFYVNDLNFAQQLATGDWVYDRSTLTPGGQTSVITQVELIGEPNTVMLRNPRHKMRTYFRESRVDNDTMERIIRLLEAEPDVRISPGFLWHIKHRPNYRWLLRNYFIDHNDTSILTLLGLLAPGVTRCTQHIISYK